MMRADLTRTLAITAILALPLAAAPNFSGNWVLNAAKSQYGQFPKPEVMRRQIDHKDPALSISTYQKGTEGASLSELKYTTNGKLSVNGEEKGTAHWENSKLVIETTLDYQGTKLAQREEWTLSPDGKALTIITHVKVPNGEVEVKQVFDRVR